MKNAWHIALISLVTAFTHSSCSKDKAAVPVSSDVPAKVSVGAKVNSAVCYPYDSCIVHFSLEIKGFTPPIQVTWLEPNVLNGASDLSILLGTEQKLKARVEDAQSHMLMLDTVFRKTDFDSLVFDYRIPDLGKYKGNTQNSSMYFDGANWVTTYGPINPAELEIMKDADFGSIKLKGFGSNSPMWYRFHTSQFLGYHTNGFFSQDSVFISYQVGLGPS